MRLRSEYQLPKPPTPDESGQSQSSFGRSRRAVRGWKAGDAGVLEYLREQDRALEFFIRDVLDAVNSNEASALLIQEGNSKPDASRQLNGRFCATEKSDGGSPAKDELWWCKWDGTAYAWEKIK